jgi:hypothetical protein
MDTTFEQSLLLLGLLFGNGLEGDVRLDGSSAEAVLALPGLLTNLGSCQPIDPPRDSALYWPGDECFRQHAEARVFLCSTPSDATQS